MKFAYFLLYFFVSSSLNAQNCDKFLTENIKKKYQKYKTLNQSGESYFLRIVQYNNSRSGAFLFLTPSKLWKIYIVDITKAEIYTFVNKDLWQDSLQPAGNAIIGSFSKFGSTDNGTYHPISLFVRFQAGKVKKSKCWNVLISDRINQHKYMKALVHFANYFFYSQGNHKWAGNLMKIE